MIYPSLDEKHFLESNFVHSYRKQYPDCIDISGCNVLHYTKLNSVNYTKQNIIWTSVLANSSFHTFGSNFTAFILRYGYKCTSVNIMFPLMN